MIGYKTTTPIQLANIVWAVNERQVDNQAVRVYFACLEMQAIREAARRYRTRRRETPREFSRYRLDEIVRLTGLPFRAVRRALVQLDRAGLVHHADDAIHPATGSLAGSERILSALACRRSFSRPIPVPRTLLHFLAKNPRLALTKTVIGYVARGLSLSQQDGRISNRGTAKISWMATTMGLSERAVSYTRAELIDLGWIPRDTGSIQRKLNRDGAYFVIDLNWRWKERASGPQFETPKPGEGITFVKRDKQCASFAPPPSKIRPKFAPPIENNKTSLERDQNQKTHPTERSVTGVFGKGKAAGPSLRNIQPDDLRHLDRLDELYFQAVDCGWLAPSEAMALNFVGAAVKAQEEGDDPVCLFVSIVRKGLWHHIKLGQEDQARTALRRYTEDDPERFRWRASSRGSNRSAADTRVEPRIIRADFTGRPHP